MKNETPATISRRAALQLVGAAIPAAATVPFRPSAGAQWSGDWDKAVIRAAASRLDKSYDQKERLLQRRVGAEYRYHTNLRSTVAHPLRDSIEYALLLLETGEAARIARALEVLDRALPLQAADPAGKWYGLWGYYLEEPPDKMSPADWNWADFNGVTLLLAMLRHQAHLPATMQSRVREAIRHAAISIRRRNVSMNYTNIAAKGTFVTMLAAELLDDKELHQYAAERLRRFAAAIDVTSSFAEYNSPTYAKVTIESLTLLNSHAKDKAARELSERLLHRCWEHIAQHWHAPTAQTAGPMSRCYATDIGRPVWMQKATNGKLSFAALSEVDKLSVPGDVGFVAYRCPPDLLPLFAELKAAREHRELYIAAPENSAKSAKSAARPVQGTTWLHPRFTLGSVNRGDFWVQRRPLLAFWGDNSRPAKFLQARFIKKDAQDEYDFSSALFYSVQQENCVLGAVNFRSPGGDKHISLDPIADGEFKASRFYLQFLLRGWNRRSLVLLDGQSWNPAVAIYAPTTRVTLQTDDLHIGIAPRLAVLGTFKPSLRLKAEGDELSVELEMLGASELQTIRWREVTEACAAFSLVMESRHGTLSQFDQRCARQHCETKLTDSSMTLNWASSAGSLQLTAGKRIQTVAAQDALFEERLNGEPLPIVRLSNHRLV